MGSIRNYFEEMSKFEDYAIFIRKKLFEDLSWIFEIFLAQITELNKRFHNKVSQIIKINSTITEFYNIMINILLK